MTDMSAGGSHSASAAQPAAGVDEMTDEIMDEMTAKQQVVEAGKLLLAEQLVARTWGNVSCRVDAEHFAISPSGLSYELTTPADVAIYNMNSGEYVGERKPSSEKGIHAAAYRQFPDAGFVIHTHQAFATALGLAGLDGLELSDEERAALGDIAVAGYGLPGTKKLLANVAAKLAEGAEVVLMKQHGALLVGRDMQQAFARAQLLEDVCRRACKGQPAASGVAAVAAAGDTEQLLKELQAQFAHVGICAKPAVLKAAAEKRSLPAQLDDMAQMIGAELAVVAANRTAIAAALQKQEVVLAPSIGAVCRADNADDLLALQLLVEKACIAHLHTQALGVSAKLGFIDTHLMRFIYKTKYSKKAQG